MRKISFYITYVAAAIVLLFLDTLHLEGAGSEYDKYFRTDSAHVYAWDIPTSSWIPTSVQLYTYDQGKIVRVLTVNYVTRANQAKTEYLYNIDGLLEIEINYTYNNGWVDLTRNLYSYDPYGRYAEIRIQKWLNSDWVDDRVQQNYLYDEFDRQLEFQAIYLRNNIWSDPTTDYSYYSSDNRLVRREAIYYTGATDYQIIYNYNVAGLLSEAYAQYPSGAGWNNWWLAEYVYNQCGLRISQVRSVGSGTEWVPASKIINFTYFKPELYPSRRIAVCHNGKTLTIRTNAVLVHLNHGDCLGPCPGDDVSAADLNGNTAAMLPAPPFTVYPNPAGERMTVALNRGEEAGFTKIELLDLKGNLLRTITASGEEQVSIPRDGLAGGQYFLRVYAGEVYSLMVIFR